MSTGNPSFVAKVYASDDPAAELRALSDPDLRKVTRCAAAEPVDEEILAPALMEAAARFMNQGKEQT